MAFNLDALKRNKGAFTHKVSNPELKVLELELSKIQPDPRQPRKTFNEEQLSELADSIRQYGLIQPIVVRRLGESYCIVSGERRFRAVQKLGETIIRAVLKENINESELGYIQMAENNQRADLSDYETALFVLDRLENGETQNEIANALHISKSTISMFTRWNEFPVFLQEAVKSKKLSIFLAYPLFLKWKDFPAETESFVVSNEEISTREIRQFDPSNPLEEPIPTPEAANFDEENSDLESVSVEDESDQKTEEEFDQTEYHDLTDDRDEDNYVQKTTIVADDEPPEPAPCQLSEGKENFSDSDIVSEPEYLASSVEKAPAPITPISEEETETEFLADPLILCTAEGREAELLYRKIASDGFVFVKWDDGTIEEIPAEYAVINRIIEATR